jgi:hypothetical protein
MRWFRAPWLAAPVLALCLVAQLEHASAQLVSPSISPARIEVNSLIAPGVRTDLPPLAVHNNGSEPMRVRMSVLAVDSDDTGREATAWIRLNPEEFVVPPGGAQTVAVALDVPRDAPRTSHAVMIRAGLVRGPSEGGATISLGVGVASALRFEVGVPPASVPGPGLMRLLPAFAIGLLAMSLTVVAPGMAHRLARAGLRRREPVPPLTAAYLAGESPDDRRDLPRVQVRRR